VKQVRKKKGTGQDTVNPLLNEKDFIDLATFNASNIKSAAKPSKFTFTYLKNTLDLLAPTLEADKIDQLIKSLNVLHNQKRKEESDKGKKTTKGKPAINIGKGTRLEASGALDAFSGMKEKQENLDEDFEEDDFM